MSPERAPSRAAIRDAEILAADSTGDEEDLDELARFASTLQIDED